MYPQIHPLKVCSQCEQRNQCTFFSSLTCCLISQRLKYLFPGSKTSPKKGKGKNSTRGRKRKRTETPKPKGIVQITQCYRFIAERLGVRLITMQAQRALVGSQSEDSTALSQQHFTISSGLTLHKLGVKYMMRMRIPSMILYSHVIKYVQLMGAYSLISAGLQVIL